MKKFISDNTYHQFYVADREIEQDAPTEWTDDDVARRHLTSKYISALCPEGDIDATIFSCGPDDPFPHFPDNPDYEVMTHIETPSGKIGIYGWPWELEDQYDFPPGICDIHFQAFAVDKADEQGDYYLVKVSSRKVEPFAAPDAAPPRRRA